MAEARALLAEVEAEVAEQRRRLEAGEAAWLQARIEEARGGFEPWTAIRPERLASVEGTRLVCGDDLTIRAAPGERPQDDYVITEEVIVEEYVVDDIDDDYYEDDYY